jgi:hypothetical protein
MMGGSRASMLVLAVLSKAAFSSAFSAVPSRVLRLRPLELSGLRALRAVGDGPSKEQGGGPALPGISRRVLLHASAAAAVPLFARLDSTAM